MSMIGNFGLLSSREIEFLLRTPDSIDEFLHAEDRDVVDDAFHCVDKRWHAIHYMLNRKEWSGKPPLDFIVAGGAKVGDIDLGYGPARVFTPPELAGIVAALRPITDDTLRASFTEDALEGVDMYAGFGADDVDDVIASLRGLQQFLERGAQQRLGLIVWCD